MKPVNDVHSITTKVRTCPHGTWHISDAREQFWPDALPDATQWRINHGAPVPGPLMLGAPKMEK